MVRLREGDILKGGFEAVWSPDDVELNYGVSDDDAQTGNDGLGNES